MSHSSGQILFSRGLASAPMSGKFEKVAMLFYLQKKTKNTELELHDFQLELLILVRLTIWFSAIAFVATQKPVNTTKGKK